jgi:uncharacterized protein (UPF0335 family)
MAYASHAKPETSQMTAIGHNSGDASAHPDILNQTAQGQLRGIVERVERLEKEKAEIADQIREVYRRGEGQRLRREDVAQDDRDSKMDRAKRQEEEAILDLYLTALGEWMLS